MKGIDSECGSDMKFALMRLSHICVDDKISSVGGSLKPPLAFEI